MCRRQQPFWTDWGNGHHYVGIMYAGRNKAGKDELVYVAINAYWQEQTVTLPAAPEGMHFYLMIDTFREISVVQDKVELGGSFTIPPRTVYVLEAFPIIG